MIIPASVWLGRIEVGQRFRVQEAETGREMGTGSVETVSPYVGARDFRTEDRLERLGLTEAPVGLCVVCTRIGAAGR